MVESPGMNCWGICYAWGMIQRRRRRWRVCIEDATGRNISESFDHRPVVDDVREVLDMAKRWDLVEIQNVDIVEGLE